MSRIMNTAQTFEDVLNSIENKKLKIIEPITENDIIESGENISADVLNKMVMRLIQNGAMKMA